MGFYARADLVFFLDPVADAYFGPFANLGCFLQLGFTELVDDLAGSRLSGQGERRKSYEQDHRCL